jgi:hypothetical protein
MRQAALKLKMSMNASNISITNNNREMTRVILNSMLFIIAFLAFSYVLVLGNMVFDIVARKALEKEMLVLNNEVGQLELSYLNLAGNTDLTVAQEMGFKEIASTFATRKSLGYNTKGDNISLSRGNNEI